MLHHRELHSVHCFKLCLGWCGQVRVAFALPAGNWIAGETEEGRDLVVPCCLKETDVTGWLYVVRFESKFG